ncbi:TlpA family protein disulfide reductase [Streptomyces chattanoogensis]|uniref:TlpA family protein disulfide reductase n=1 Tax=Streptomyces chattanoogensis TaxID=66876 RepID=UPI0036C3420A
MSSRTARTTPTAPPACGRTAFLAAAAAAVAGVLALSACGPGGSGGDGSSGAGFGRSADRTATVPPADRKAAPELSGTTTRGKRLDVADYRGKVVVLNVWSSTCGPCIAEAPGLVNVARSSRVKGVRFVGINTRDAETSQATAFEEQHKVPYPSLSDPAGRLLLRFPKGSLNPQSIPATLVLDRHGRLAARTMGAVDEDTLRKMIAPLVKEK